MFKKCIVLVLTALFTSMTIPQHTIKADVYENQETYTIDLETAETLAMLFVKRSLNSDLAWNENTTVMNIIPLYDINDDICAYCVNLITENERSGYITISANLKDSLFQEYSDCALLVFEEMSNIGNRQATNISIPEIIYYNGPLQYSCNKDIYMYTTNNTNEEYYINNIQLINSISSTAAPQTIISPGTYLDDLYDPNLFYLDSSSYITGVTPYIIEGTNACAVYGVACILDYHLRSIDNVSFTTRVNTCKSIAVAGGYAHVLDTYTNYYIDVGDLKDFASDCISVYGSSLTANSDLFFPWNSAKSEITNKRPVLINIWKEPGSGYEDHTVVAFGWSLYKDLNNNEYRFYRVYDGYTNATRYVDVERINIYYITRIY